MKIILVEKINFLITRYKDFNELKLDKLDKKNYIYFII